ncbi:UNVERIFIED_CONTAM: hypothetical protein Slati_0470600 [Sesamum latifolium]|uniref:Uncharacterized protein n=1 Tax=Sesamum latifolium TaxID=2727402 RepID=A0AAW2XWE7_9LAMI
MAKYQKEEEEVKRLQREVHALQEEHAEELQVQADQVRKEFPETEEKESPGSLLGQPFGRAQV